MRLSEIPLSSSIEKMFVYEQKRYRFMVLFEIKNKDEAYSTCYQIIQSIERNVRFVLEPLSEEKRTNGLLDIKLYLVYSDEIYQTIQEIEQVNCGEAQALHTAEIIDSLPANILKDRVLYYFRVQTLLRDDQYDYINVMSFCQIRRLFPGKCYLGYKVHDMPTIQRLSHYMLYESIVDFQKWQTTLEEEGLVSTTRLSFPVTTSQELYNQIFTIQERGKIARLAIHKIGSLNAFLPLLYIADDIYKLLSTNLHRYHIPTISFDTSHQRDYINKAQKALDGKKGILDFDGKILNKKAYQRLIFETIYIDICLDMLKDCKILTENNDQNSKFFKSIEDMSLLSFLFFCAMCKGIYDVQKSINQTELRTLMQSAQDFSDGLLQLIDNAITYAMHPYFSFRIYDTSNKKKLNHLVNEYKDYQFVEGSFYLEVKLIDSIKSLDLVDTFIKNMDDRNKKKDEHIDEELLENIKTYLSLGNIFSPDEQMRQYWKEYFSNGVKIANHYGLQLYDLTVQMHNGFFQVVSSSESSIEIENGRMSYQTHTKKAPHAKQFPYIPGTRYTTVFPLILAKEQHQVGINISLDYCDVLLQEQWKENQLSVPIVMPELLDYDQLLVNGFNQDKKKDIINELVQRINERYQSDSIFVFDVSGIETLKSAEYFTKAFISFIFKKRGETMRIAIINSSSRFIINFTRCFTVFYDKLGECVPMDQTLIYISDGELRTEMLFSGCDITSALKSSEFLAYSKGEFNECVDILAMNLRKRTHKEGSLSKENLLLAPFDIALKQNGVTRFEGKVNELLNNDIQRINFGCKLDGIHMRVGSKIHVIDHFYEAELLFNTSYYYTRFAYLLVKQIMKNTPANEDKQMILVGYETYSEMLVVEMVNLLKILYNIQSSYIIFHQANHVEFKFLQENSTDARFILIVPINSTLTTHSKMADELKRQLRNSSTNRKLNLAVVLIRDSSKKTQGGMVLGKLLPANLSEIENIYWEGFDESNRIVRTRNTSPQEVYYNILVSSKWEEPLQCKYCFPPTPPLDEHPIVEVNRASVVPMIMIGLNDPDFGEQPNLKHAIPQELIDLISRPSIVCYNHYRRKNNHFQYYFKTDQLLQEIKQSTKQLKRFQRWINDCVDQLTKQKENYREDQYAHIYDIIVAPIHYSNAAFVEEINTLVFANATVVIYLDTDREYRDNVKTKYSNLTALYNNIKITQRRSVINFHFVDDTIISGGSFYRAKSLIQSLFPVDQQNDPDIQVNIFDNVFVLLNRCSSYTMLNYVCSSNRFHAYINLNIPSLRNHQEDSCYLCALAKSYNHLEEYATTNLMAELWCDKRAKYKVKNIDEINEGKSANNNTIKEPRANEKEYVRRAASRLQCSQHIYAKLADLGYKKNDPQSVLLMFLTIIDLKSKKSNREKLERLISYIKVLSRPFLCYRKSILETSFSFMLNLLHFIVSDEAERQEIMIRLSLVVDDAEKLGYQSVYQFIQDCAGDKKLKQPMDALYKTLVSRLVSQGSTYIIRKKNMVKIMAYVITNFIPADSRQTEKRFDMELWHAAMFKKLLNLSKDETTSLWLEFLLLYGNEYKYGAGKAKTPFEYGIDSSFGQLLYLENTYVIRDAIQELFNELKRTTSKEFETSICQNIQLYYFDNLRKLLAFNRSYFATGNALSHENATNYEPDDIDLSELINMTYLFQHLEGDSKVYKDLEEAESFYENLIGYILNITGAEKISMIGKDGRNGNECFTIAMNPRIDGKVDSNDGIPPNTCKEFIMGIVPSQSIANTVYFADNNTVILLFTPADTQVQSMDPIYILLQFEPTLSRPYIINHIRNVLVMRNRIMNILERDFQTNIAKLLVESKNTISSYDFDKAISHTPTKYLDMVNYKLNAYDPVGRSETELEAVAMMAKLSADSMISQMYRDLKRNENSSSGLSSYVLDLVNMLPWLSLLTCLRPEDSIQSPTRIRIELDKRLYRFRYAFPTKQSNDLLLILVALIQNAAKYGKKEDNRVMIWIQREHEKIVLSNKRDRDPSQKHASSDGITLTSISQYIFRHYGKEMDYGKDPNNLDLYRVILPVLECQGEID